MKITVYKPPHQDPAVYNYIITRDFGLSVFLAGSIEMGTAREWQTELTEHLKNIFENVYGDSRLDIFNPRRDDWDSSWEQKRSNPKFSEQVLWELNYLETASIKVFYFDPDTKSPVTMMELGLMLGKCPNDCYVCCSAGFWRAGNVDITTRFYNAHFFEDFEELKKAVASRIVKEAAFI